MVSLRASPLAVREGAYAEGQSAYVATLAEALADRGHEVDVYTRRDAWERPAHSQMGPAVRVVHATAGPLRPLPEAELPSHVHAFARRLVRDWTSGPAPDVVHAHCWMSGAAAVIAARVAGVPVVQTFHTLAGGDEADPPERPPTEADLIGNVDLMTVTCRRRAEELVARGAPDDRVALVRPGVDTARFTPDGEAWPRMDHRRLLALGSMIGHKGVDTVIEALTDLPDCELVFAGGPPAASVRVDGEGRRLTALARDLGVDSRFHLTGSVGHDTVPAMLRSADVVVAVPDVRTCGLGALEAMSCGRPVVASPVDTLADSVDDGTTGLVVPPGDPDAVAAAVRKVTEDRTFAERIGAAGRERAVEHHDRQRTVQDVEDAYLAAMVLRRESPVEAV